MPPKYHIASSPVPGRFQEITRSGVIAWEEGCLKCPVCVKTQCVYKVYEQRSLDTRQMLDSLDSACQDCFRCVQNCPARLISKGMNPAYRAIGNDYWTAEILSNIWFQAETGRIPVSGAGYGGAFSGVGFDAMWTDMSEIVRPTRDGIHGREYISTSVDVGRKPLLLGFDENGAITSPTYPLVELPLPVVFDIMPFSPPPTQIRRALLQAASRLGTMALVPESRWLPEYDPFLGSAVLYMDRGVRGLKKEMMDKIRLVEIPDGPRALQRQASIKEKNPAIVVAIRVEMSPVAGRRTLELAKAGTEVIHLMADFRGREKAAEPLFVKDRMKEIHLSLVDKGIRDQVTIIAGGGVAMAEHMAKLIICGADLISCDVAALAAMECRVCRRCSQGISCPVDLDTVDESWGAARVCNLMSGWHSQLLEVLGAMGIREVRRLRGEMGRAMFFEDLEKEFAGLGRRE